MGKKEKGRQKELVTVPGLDRGLEILEFLSSSERGKTQMEIADTLHLPVSSVARITLQLEATGWLSRNPDSRVFRLTMKMLTIGQRAQQQRLTACGAPPDEHNRRLFAGEVRVG